MPNEKQSSNVVDEPASQAEVISNTRRALVKGGAWATPILLTLPRISRAASSAEQCVEATSGILPDEAIGNLLYVSVTRPTYVIALVGDPATTKTVVNASLTLPLDCLTGPWHGIDDWGLYTATSCSGAIPTALTGPASTSWTGDAGQTAGSVSVIVQVDATGMPIALGPSDTDTHIISESCWASANGGQPLPQ